MTQLNSNVIRIFKQKYSSRSKPDLLKIVSGKVDIHAHVIIMWGIKMKLWKKVGHVPYEAGSEALFRGSKDHSNPKIKLSHNWYVWKINEPFQYVGKLEGEHKKADIGMVISPAGIVHRMRTGKYHFLYPNY